MNPVPEITFGSPVTACDCPLPGRVNMVWPTGGGTYYRVQFPPRSPFLGDWAVYRAHELTASTSSTKSTPSTP